MSSAETNSKECIQLPLPSDSPSSTEVVKCIHDCAVDNEVQDRDKRRLIFVSVICLLFIVAEVTGAILSNSLAIASDASHLMVDFGAFMLSLAAVMIASKPPTRRMSFGFHRAEILAALLSVLSIWLITGILVYLAVERIIYSDYEIDATVMMYVSIFGIFANVIMGLVLMLYEGKNSKDSKSRTTVNKSESINIRAAAIHIIGDLFQSIGVLIASLIIYFKPHLKIVDPICTFVFAIIVLFTTFNIIANIFNVLMEGFPEHLNFAEVRKILYSIPGVARIHSMRMWSLCLENVAMSVHIIVHKGENHSTVLKNASAIICEKLNIHEVTIQIEEMNEPLDHNH